jgi:hypothetical protein
MHKEIIHVLYKSPISLQIEVSKDNHNLTLAIPTWYGTQLTPYDVHVQSPYLSVTTPLIFTLHSSITQIL